LFSYIFSMSFLRDEGSIPICEYRILVVAILEDLSLNVETEMRTRYTHFMHIQRYVCRRANTFCTLTSGFRRV